MPSRDTDPTLHGRTGVPVDAHGGPTVDPTKNVLDLVDAAVARQDDLRAALEKRLETEVQFVKDLVAANDRRYEQRFENAERAVSKAETAAEKRFDSVNEFRNTLADQQRTLMPRSEVGVVAASLSDKIHALDASMAGKIGALEKQFDTQQAERQGIKGGWGYAVGIVGFVLTLLSIGALVLRTP